MPKPRVDLSNKGDYEGDVSQSVFITDAIEGPDSGMAQGGKRKRVEFVPLTYVLPDEFQGRLLLPSSIAPAFFNFEIDCFEAGRRWLALGEHDRGWAMRIKDILFLGESLAVDGQIKAATGKWVNVDGRRLLALETGERRFWGLVLNSLLTDRDEEDVRLEVVNVDEPSRIRQIVENERFEIPNAVSRARSIAGLLLYLLDIQPAHGVYGRYDYHRLILSERVPMKVWGEAQKVIGVSRSRLEQLLSLLRISDSALDLADVYSIHDGIIREIQSNFSDADWDIALQDWIEANIHMDESHEAPEKKSGKPRRAKTPPAEKAARNLTTIIFGNRTKQAVAVNELADNLFVENDSLEKVKAVEEYLEDLLNALRSRRERY